MHRNSIHWDKKQWRRPLLGLQEVHYNQSNLTCIVLVTGQPLSISHMLIKIVSQSPQGVVIILVITIVEHIGLILTITDPLHCNYQLSGCQAYTHTMWLCHFFLKIWRHVILTTAMWNISNITLELTTEQCQCVASIFLVQRFVHHYST